MSDDTRSTPSDADSASDAAMGALLRAHATRHAADDALRAAVRTQVTLAEAGRQPGDAPRGAPAVAPTASALPRAAPAVTPRWRLPLATFASGLLIGGLLTLMMTSLLRGVAPAAPSDADIVRLHVMALREGPLVQVASSDRHAVKPWFQGRLDFAPPVIDLAGEGFVLAGGRIEHLQGALAAGLVYRRDAHVIDLFVWPMDGTPSTEAPRSSTHRGFNLVEWADGAMRYRAVSDLDSRELKRFAAALRAARGGT